MTPDHEFHALWFDLAWHGPEDVHAHPCIADGHEMSQWSGGCGLVLIGWGRGCQGPFASHFRAKLDDHASVERAVRRLKEGVRASAG